MKTSVSEGRHRIQWIAWMQIDYLDFTDDLASLSHLQQQIQVKTAKVVSVSTATGLNIHMRKSNILKYKAKTNQV
ncbi:unnamed protein product [Schistosoma margrebowiei]|uniref:Reverse transcriptase domain-containing protein n=1 Tax=Schistosoma margrebowiei TaxID=48269 RepID=A0A183MA08_9TREM|nr:unnamed protein product [Schistosoma margrebowiei]VDP51084.1 unnamed protein product [Schistosoma margrebowiei]VDP51085.1 unnamed protein product [Schistosoma margrebowiei]